jgi:DNA sulfur modification protein DndE
VLEGGSFLSGPLNLRSHVELVIAEGTILAFSPDRDLYPPAMTLYAGLNAVRCTAPISADHCEDIAISGHGIIDGNGEGWRHVKKVKVSAEHWDRLCASGGVIEEDGLVWWPSEAAIAAKAEVQRLIRQGAPSGDYLPWRDALGPTLIKFTNCQSVRLEGVTFRNSATWMLHLALCRDVTIDGITAWNPHYAQNGDALDLESCTDVRVTRSRFDAGDDAICIKSGRDAEGRARNRPSERIEVRDCEVGTGHGGIVIGSETSGGVRDVIVENLQCRGTDRGIRIKTARGRGNVIENLKFQNILLSAIRGAAIEISMFYESSVGTTAEIDDGTPHIRNIEISHLQCDGSRRAIFVKGLPEAPIENLTITNISAASQNSSSICNVSGLKLRELRMTTRRGPSLLFQQVTDVELNAISA